MAEKEDTRSEFGVKRDLNLSLQKILTNDHELGKGGDFRPKFLPDGSGKKWRGRPPKSPLYYTDQSTGVVDDKTREAIGKLFKGKKISGSIRRLGESSMLPASERYTTEPYSSTRADLIYKEHYGEDTDRKLKEASEARNPSPRYVPYTDKQRDLYLRFKKANRIPEQRSETYSRGKPLGGILRNSDPSGRALPQDATKIAKYTLPVYRDEATDKKLNEGIGDKRIAGRYLPSERAILMRPKLSTWMGDKEAKESDKHLLHHEVRHHMNMTNPEYTDKYISPYLPKEGNLASGKYTHAFFSPNELTEAIANLKQQDYKATGIDMTEERLNRLINSKELPAHFRGLMGPQNIDNAGHFIKALREWKKEDPKKGKALIDEILKIQDQVVDVRKPKFFPEQLA